MIKYYYHSEKNFFVDKNFLFEISHDMYIVVDGKIAILLLNNECSAKRWLWDRILYTCHFSWHDIFLSGVNQLDGFAPSSGTPETPGQAPLTSFRTLPAKSNLKRRLTDCMEGDESQSNPDEPVKKKRNIQFDAVTVYYFPRTQGFTCVPSQVSPKIVFPLSHFFKFLSSNFMRVFSFYIFCIFISNVLLYF